MERVPDLVDGKVFLAFDYATLLVAKMTAANIYKFRSCDRDLANFNLAKFARVAEDCLPDYCHILIAF
jgi:hypothetical protein